MEVAEGFSSLFFSSLLLPRTGATSASAFTVIRKFIEASRREKFITIALADIGALHRGHSFIFLA